MPTKTGGKKSLNPADGMWDDKLRSDLKSLDAVGSSDEEKAIQRARAWDPNNPDDEDGDDEDDSDSSLQNREGDQKQPASLYHNGRGPKRSTGNIMANLGKMFRSKKAATSLVGAFTGATFIGSSLLAGPAALGAVLERVLTNHNDNDSRVTIMMRRAYIGGILSQKVHNVPVLDRMTSISEAQKKTWEKNGFKVEGTLKDGRIKPSAFVFPDGKRVTTGKEFYAHANNNKEARKAANLVFNPRGSTYTDKNSKFKAKILSKWKISISDRMRGSTSRDKDVRNEAHDKALNSRIGVTNTDNNSLLDKARSGIKSSAGMQAVDRFAGKIKGVTNVADIASLGCTAYAMIKTSVAAVKLYYYQEIIKFGIPFAQYIAQVMAGHGDPELTEYYFGKLTAYGTDESDEYNYNKSAFDSNGLQSALHGDFSALAEEAKKYTTWYMVAAVAGNAVTTKVEDYMNGKENVQTFCQSARAASLAGSVFCLTSFVSAGICALVIGGMYLLADEITEYIQETITEDAVKIIANADLTSNLKGRPLGDALSSFMGLLLLQKSQGAGMRMATSALAVNEFISATESDYQTYVEGIARDEASENPFDTTNQYSFINQLSLGLNPYQQEGTPVFNQIANIVSVSTNLFSTILNPTAGALQHMPNELTRRGLQYTEASLVRCGDDELKAIGVVCQADGKPIAYVRKEVVKLAYAMADGDTSMIENTVKYMIDRGYIGEDGGTVESDEDKKQYVYYKQYCTEERVYPFGTSEYDYGQTPTSEEEKTELSWALGARCAGNNVDGTPGDNGLQTMLDHFFIYYHTCETQVLIADGVDCSSTAQATTTTTSTGQWTLPVVGVCGDGLGAGRGHAGLDIAASAGTPLVAPTRLRVVGEQTEKQNPNGGNTLIMASDDGTGYGFIFMHMQSMSPLSIGDFVEKGDPVGVVGNTGVSSGPHLHMEVYPPGSDPNSFSGEVDPIATFAANGAPIPGCVG